MAEAKDRAGRRKEGRDGGGTAQTLLHAVVTWHAAKGCWCRAAFSRAVVKSMGQGGGRRDGAHALHIKALY